MPKLLANPRDVLVEPEGGAETARRRQLHDARRDQRLGDQCREHEEDHRGDAAQDRSHDHYGRTHGLPDHCPENPDPHDNRAHGNYRERIPQNNSQRLEAVGQHAAEIVPIGHRVLVTAQGSPRRPHPEAKRLMIRRKPS